MSSPIVGLGVDLVDVGRFARVMGRTPGVAERLFTAEERTHDGAPRSAASLAARFAAKEAAVKALGGPPGLRWHDVTVVAEPTGRPRLVVSGELAAAAARAGVRDWQVSLSHDGTSAVAVVLAQR
jgi:holo-[acyl-carrier protein] synthase